jgi:hypothetical protein
MDIHSEARIPSASAGRYLVQLCKHFAHRVPVTLQEDSGAIVFDTGVCALKASDGVLTMALDAADAEGMSKLKDVVARHLVRFAFREDLLIEWNE